MSSLLPLFYLAAAGALFWLSVTYQTDPMRRVRVYFLAFSSMCFGSGRLLFAITPQDLPDYEWIFNLGHLSLVVFVGLFVHGAVTDVRSKYWTRDDGR